MRKYCIAILLSGSLVSFSVSAQVKTSAQEVATPELAQQREELKKAIIANYLGMKNSLVVSDTKKTAIYAADFTNALDKFKFKKLSLDEMNVATTARAKIQELAKHMVVTTSINEQRNDMEKLSVELWNIIDRVKPEKTTLYQQKCPMMGTIWLSDDKKIENPYYPKNMLTCGEVIGEK